MPRVVYSLQLDFEPRRPGEFVQLIAPLDADGQSPYCRAVLPKTRVIDLRVGATSRTIARDGRASRRIETPLS